MKKLLKKITAIFLTAMMTLTVGVSAFAAEEKEVMELPAGWETIDMSEIPEGIIPLYVDDIEEAEEIVNRIHGAMLVREASSENILPLSLLASGKDEKQSKKNGGPMIGTDFNVEIRYDYSGNKFTACRNISSFLTGITAYLDWRQTDSWYDFLSNDTLLRTHVSGDLIVYVATPNSPIKYNDHYTDIQTDFTV